MDSWMTKVGVQTGEREMVIGPGCPLDIGGGGVHALPGELNGKIIISLKISCVQKAKSTNYHSKKVGGIPNALQHLSVAFSQQPINVTPILQEAGLLLQATQKTKFLMETLSQTKWDDKNIGQTRTKKQQNWYNYSKQKYVQLFFFFDHCNYFWHMRKTI